MTLEFKFLSEALSTKDRASAYSRARSLVRSLDRLLERSINRAVRTHLKVWARLRGVRTVRNRYAVPRLCRPYLVIGHLTYAAFLDHGIQYRARYLLSSLPCILVHTVYYRCQYYSIELYVLIARPAPGARLARRVYRNYDRQLTEV